MISGGSVHTRSSGSKAKMACQKTWRKTPQPMASSKQGKKGGLQDKNILFYVIPPSTRPSILIAPSATKSSQKCRTSKIHSPSTRSSSDQMVFGDIFQSKPQQQSLVYFMDNEILLQKAIRNTYMVFCITYILHFL